MIVDQRGDDASIDVVLDCANGATFRVAPEIFTRLGVAHVQIRGSQDPLFPGINPEPIEPHIRALGEAVVANGCQAGLCTDGDADRIGATDEHGEFVDPHKIFSVLLSWVLKRKGWPGAVTVPSSDTASAMSVILPLPPVVTD